MARSRRRLDEELVNRGLFSDKERATQAILGNHVLIDGAPAASAATLVGKNDRLSVVQKPRFVSRGGQKLQGALEDFHMNVQEKRCLDAGAGSGGFTDCLLQNGAGFVLAVDVGYGQFDWRLRNHPRVELMERTDIRSLKPEDVGLFDVIVADLSFIGLGRLVADLGSLASDPGTLILMVKPQHEAPRSRVGAGGIVRDPRTWLGALQSVASRLEQAGFSVQDAAASRLKGTEGNQEFFLQAKRSANSDPGRLLKAVETAKALNTNQVPAGLSGDPAKPWSS